ncbi:hypothetical protein AB7M17_006150 [Bradyrhizobium sp. USDA 377]
MAMLLNSKVSLGAERMEKLVRGRTKNWMEAARDLGKSLHKNCSQSQADAGAGFRIRENQMIPDDAAISTIPESSGKAI